MAAIARTLRDSKRSNADSTSSRVIKPSGLEAATRLRSRPSSRARDFAAGVAEGRADSLATAAGELADGPARDGSARSDAAALTRADADVIASLAVAFS